MKELKKTVWKCYAYAILSAWIFLLILQLSSPFPWGFFVFLLIAPAIITAIILNIIIEIVIRT